MSNKLTFEEWEKMTIESCRKAPCNVVCHECNFHQNTKTAWNFAQAQEQREIEDLKKKVEELENVINSACDEEPYSFSSYCSGLIYNHDKEIEEIKKKLEKAEKVITFYSISQNYGYSREYDNHVEWISDEEHQPMGKKARAYLKENCDE